MSDQGETESLTESTEGGVPSTSALHVANTVKFKVREREKVGDQGESYNCGEYRLATGVLFVAPGTI